MKWRKGSQDSKPNKSSKSDKHKTGANTSNKSKKVKASGNASPTAASWFSAGSSGSQTDSEVQAVVEANNDDKESVDSMNYYQMQQRNPLKDVVQLQDRADEDAIYLPLVKSGDPEEADWIKGQEQR